MDIKVVFSSIILCLVALLVPLRPVTAQTTVGDVALRTIVIDPGHGGKDPGALGKGGKVNEKHIVLAVAKKLGQKIKEQYPDVKVIYTRSNDVFIGLHERAMVARRNNEIGRASCRERV